ncbi:hypothetical protein [Staphylococcus chromogenes]|uniref:hypothetical protein n=1 Tax=Staphylococcus chromogenes TaxID=46126 RepID=UPI0029016A6B|nr:hypothetical protein [Staphylococcus chromogenes]MDU0452109.1 hypothetical protein [Staphylococcus chromogenes]
MDSIMLIVAIITLVITGVSTGIAAFQLKKLNIEKSNVNLNIKSFMLKKSK